SMRGQCRDLREEDGVADRASREEALATSHRERSAEGAGGLPHGVEEVSLAVGAGGAEREAGGGDRGAEDHRTGIDVAGAREALGVLDDAAQTEDAPLVAHQGV